MKMTAYKFSILLALAMPGCTDYITIDTPATSISTSAAFKDNAAAIQVVTGLYVRMAGSSSKGTYISTSFLPELSADNLSILDPNTEPWGEYYRNDLIPNRTDFNDIDTYWAQIYTELYTVNTAIENLTDNGDLNETVAKRLLGEAHFMRAFYYFYLVNFYFEAPLVLSTDYNTTDKKGKSSSAEIYAQIEKDLAIAEGLLDQRYVAANMVAATPDRIRPNLSAVHALQARVYLYGKKYAEAEAAASKVIGQSDYALNEVADAFLVNSSETIWSLQSVSVGYNTYEGATFILPASGPDNSAYNGHPYFATASLINSFQPGDARRSNWFGMVTVNGKDYYYPFKYKVPFIHESRDVKERCIVLRLAEQYLIRAEARNEQGKTEDAVADLNTLRAKRRNAPSVAVPNPLPALSVALTQPELRAAILRERRSELFTEGAHRWFDLRRFGTIDAVMTAEEQVKGNTWEPHKAYYPIHRGELIANPKLAQTPGYPR